MENIMINQNWIALNAQIVHKILKEKNKKVVFVESCTGGNVAGNLVTHCQGISKHLQGSFVVYNIDAKSQWLGANREYLEKYTCESDECAQELALLAAKLNDMDAIAVVGHLEPRPFHDTKGSRIFISHATPDGICENKFIKLYSTNRQAAMQEAVISTYLFAAVTL
jgi:PncC family amidohydrolase